MVFTRPFASKLYFSVFELFLRLFFLLLNAAERLERVSPLLVFLNVFFFCSASMAGKHFEKSPDSLCVVNIIPPRELWDVIQPLRNKYTANARCGPHITFIDPFVLSHQYTEACRVLEDAFASLPPFEVQLNKFGFFQHKSSSTLYLEPTAPEGMFDQLINLAVSAFPQCRDQLEKGAKSWVPHLSIGNFKNHNELLKVLDDLQKSWKPMSFLLKEVYLLARPGPDPFEVKAVAHLGGDSSSAHFGPGSHFADEKVCQQDAFDPSVTSQVS